MKMGALASGAIALGGTAAGLGGAQEDGDGATTEDGGGDTVLMLHPDAVEDSEVTVTSDQLDWSPIGDGGGTTPASGGSSFRTFMVEYGFSASHVAPVFVPEDVSLSMDDQRRLGEIQEIVEQPGGGTDGGTPDGTDGTGQGGNPVFVRMGLEEAAGAAEETPTETPTETETETPTETETETPTETPTDGGGGIFG